jgi:hypothetical protein
MSQELSVLFIRLSQFSTLIPFVFGLLYFRTLNKSFRVLFAFIVFSGIMEYVAYWYVRNISSNNLPPLHAYTVIELGFLSYIFCKEVFPKVRYLFGLIMVTGSLLAVLNAFVWGNLNAMNHISRSFECLVLVILSLAFFRQSLSTEKLVVPVLMQPMFWFSSAVLLYFSINLLFFMLFNEVFNQGNQLFVLGSNLHSFTNIFTNLLFAQSFRCFRKGA